jgi:hypothetical protein
MEGQWTWISKGWTEREDASFGILFWIEGCRMRISEGWKEELDFLGTGISGGWKDDGRKESEIFFWMKISETWRELDFILFFKWKDKRTMDEDQ